MDQMMDQIAGAAARTQPLGEEELQFVASYLTGQADWPSVKKILPRGRSGYFYYPGYAEHTGAIAAACGEEPRLLPRLGRHLRVMQVVAGGLYSRILSTFIDRLGEKAVFLDSELGAPVLLSWLFEEGYQVKPHTVELLELLDTDYPGEIEKYVQNPSSLGHLRPLAWLCGRRGWDIFLPAKDTRGLLDKLTGRGEDPEKGPPARLGERLCYTFASTLRLWGEDALADYREELRHCLPEALPTFDSSTVKGKVDKATRDRLSQIPYQLAHALVLSGWKLPNVNEMVRAVFRVNPDGFLDTLYWAAHADWGEGALLTANNPGANIGAAEHQDVMDQMGRMQEMLGAIGVSKGYLPAWMAGKMLYRPRLWRVPFETVYGGDKVLLTEAAELASDLSAPAITGMLEPSQKTVEELAQRSAELFVDRAAVPCGADDASQVAAWLLDGVGAVEELPDLGTYYEPNSRHYRALPPHYDADYSILCLAGKHPIAGRYLRYIANKGYGYRLEYCAAFLMDYLLLPPEDAAAFLARETDAGETLLLLALRDGVQGEGHPTPLMRLFRALAALQPEAAAAAMKHKDCDAAARLPLLEAIYTAHPEYDSGFLLSCLEDSSKKVRQYAVSFLLPRKDLTEEVRPLLNAKKKQVREAAEGLMAAYEGESTAGEDAADLVAICTRLLPRSGMASIRWAIPGEVPAVRWRDSGEKADPVVVQCYLCLMLGAKSIDLPPQAARIREELRESDLSAIARDIYRSWLADGANTKQKAALLLFGVHATDPDVLALQKQIDDWAQHSRGAIAAEAVRAMALGGSDLALMTVDSMSRKFKNKQVRRAAGEAFAAAAAALNTTPEALGDRIIPTLGFDERGERVVDYGPRQFTAILSPALTVELQDESGKRIKSLPKPGAKDDTEKAEAAKAEFSALKKSLKAVVSTQVARLGQALATGRGWTTGAWTKLFVQNPIMHCFAIGLIWGVYEEDRLVEGFRYLEDGGFTTVDEDDFTPADNVEIRLVHPLDLSEEMLASWKTQLEDYEVTQPIPQLERTVYRLLPEERSSLAVDRFGGRRVLGITLANRLQKAGWYKGSVQDAGVFYTFYREIGAVGIQLYFSGMYVSPDLTEMVTVGQAGFYRAGSVSRGSYVYDDVTKEEILPPAEVSPRLFSEMMLELDLATVGSDDPDGGWKTERELLFFNGK